MTTPPTPSAVSNTRPLLWAGLAGAAAMLLLVLAVLVGYWLGRSDQPQAQSQAQAQAAHTTATHASNPTARAEHLDLQPIVTNPIATTDPSLTATLPADTALAGEELDVHQDEQTRLLQQKQSLNQQVNDSTQLIQLKAQQIADLEKQLNSPDTP